MADYDRNWERIGQKYQPYPKTLPLVVRKNKPRNKDVTTNSESV